MDSPRQPQQAIQGALHTLNTATHKYSLDETWAATFESVIDSIMIMVNCRSGEILQSMREQGFKLICAMIETQPRSRLHMFSKKIQTTMMIRDKILA